MRIVAPYIFVSAGVKKGADSIFFAKIYFLTLFLICNVPEWSKIVQNGPKWSKMFHNYMKKIKKFGKWLIKVQNGPQAKKNLIWLDNVN